MNKILFDELTSVKKKKRWHFQTISIYSAGRDSGRNINQILKYFRVVWISIVSDYQCIRNTNKPYELRSVVAVVEHFWFETVEEKHQ